MRERERDHEEIIIVNMMMWQAGLTHNSATVKCRNKLNILIIIWRKLGKTVAKCLFFLFKSSNTHKVRYCSPERSVRIQEFSVSRVL